MTFFRMSAGNRGDAEMLRHPPVYPVRFLERSNPKMFGKNQINPRNCDQSSPKLTDSLDGDLLLVLH